MKQLGVVPFKIEKNPSGSYAVIENPDSEDYGIHGWLGDRVVRTPFQSAEEAKQREIDIAEHYGYKIKEVK